MFSKLEEASYSLIQNSNVKFVKSGTFNPTNFKKPNKSFFLWRIASHCLEIYQITSSKQLQHNYFYYDFTTMIDPNDINRFYLQPQIEFIEYQDNGQNMIAFYVIASNWNLYHFRILHPVKFAFLIIFYLCLFAYLCPFKLIIHSNKLTRIPMICQFYIIYMEPIHW